MANLIQTRSAVFASADATVHEKQTAAEEIQAGEFVWAPDDDSPWSKVTRGSSAAAANDAVRGIARNHAYTGQPVSVAILDPAFVPGATLTPGETYAVGSVSGSLSPLSDLAPGDYATIAGLAIDSATLNLRPSPGILKA